MKKIKDRIFLGIVCNLMASFIPQAMNLTAYKAGWTDMRFNQPAASLFLPKKKAKANTLEGKITAFLVNITMGSFMGVMMSYLLSVSGRDKATIKGAGMGALLWLGIFGFLSRLGLIVKGKKPLSNILSFIDHTVLGGITALLISRIGDNSLFPDKEISRGEKLPIVAVGDQQLNAVPSKQLRFKRHYA